MSKTLGFTLIRGTRRYDRARQHLDRHPTYNEIWVPRIGEQASVELRRNGYLTLGVFSSFLPLSIGCSFAFGSGKPAGIALGLLIVALMVTGLTIWIRSSARFAASLSQWFGAKVRRQELPKMRTNPPRGWLCWSSEPIQ
jgi:hypothetical protein